jgi:ferredoxin
LREILLFFRFFVLFPAAREQAGHSLPAAVSKRFVWDTLETSYQKELLAMTAHVNENCIGCGLCVNVCSGVFTMTDEGVAAAKDAIFPDQEPQVHEAADACPVSAIEIN